MRLVSMPVEPDYYEVLQVSAEAEHEVIGAAYKRLARKYHPDLNPDPAAALRMRDLNRAIEILGDPQKRAEYDARRRRWRARHAEPTLLPASRAADVRRRRSPIVLPAVIVAGAVSVGLAMIAIRLVFDTGDGPSVTELNATTAPQAPASSVPPESSATPVVAAASLAPATPDPTPPAQGSATFSNGTWLVGEEIAPGMWRAVRSRTCSWKRLSSLEGPDEIVAGAGSHLTVQIQSSDAAFWSEGCGWWTQILTPPSAGPSDPFGPGTWLVVEEIAPGLWQNSDSSEGCSWARLSGLDGDPSATTASGFGYSIIAIEITEIDLAFDSAGCGTWTRIGD